VEQWSNTSKLTHHIFTKDWLKGCYIPTIYCYYQQYFLSGHEQKTTGIVDQKGNLAKDLVCVIRKKKQKYILGKLTTLMCALEELYFYYSHKESDRRRVTRLVFMTFLHSR
jgi:DNA repair photolyase